MGELKPSGKSFDISKWEVQDAWEKVKANKGAPGVDKQTLGDFESDLKNNLYKIWNRMSSGSYFPPPVKAVEIPKPHGSGTRILGVPSCRGQDRANRGRGPAGEGGRTVFHPDSYGYRPGQVGPGRGGGMPESVLEVRLGDRPGYPEVLRQRAGGT